MMAAEYVGTMQMAGGFTLKEVHVTLDAQGNLTMHNVKFALLMPVRVDVLIPKVKRKNDRLTCEIATPYVDDKPQPKRVVTNLHGTITPQILSFSCQFGGKQMHYQGKAKK
jgi:hypothetical protein